MAAAVPAHACGLCDGPLTFDGWHGNETTWTCAACGWWHISTDCCTPPPTGPGICEHGERSWECAECADRAASNAAYEADMRGLGHRRTNDFGAER